MKGTVVAAGVAAEVAAEEVTETRASSAALYFANGIVAIVNGGSEAVAR